jgi:hypothetical protein
MPAGLAGQHAASHLSQQSRLVTLVKVGARDGLLDGRAIPAPGCRAR